MGEVRSFKPVTPPLKLLLLVTMDCLAFYYV